MADKICEGCDHSLGSHYKAADDSVRCLVTDSGLSTSGVIGMPWSWSCDCVDGVSEAANYQREKQKREDAERDEAIRKIVEVAGEKLKIARNKPNDK